jgi:hypothetical protein
MSMHANAISKTGLLLGLGLVACAAVAPGCGGRAATICALQCECEHCNDYEEDADCTLYETQENVAEAYNCSAQWDIWATCVEEKGICMEKEASFTTAATGSCSGLQSVGVPCMADADCQMIDNDYSCDAGMCAERVCAGGGGPCQDNDDCSGEDLCGSEENALEQCIDDASEHRGVSIDID